MSGPDTLVIGGSGLIGRWLLPELTRQGRTVAAMLRHASTRAYELRSWVAAHGGGPSRLVVTVGDLTSPGLGLTRASLEGVRDVYNLGARYAFGLPPTEARRTNVDGALEAVRWTARLPAPRRFVHISGYRFGSNHAADHACPGAYEASKVEAHRAVLALTAELGIPVTVVNPSAVIGDSATGETTQYIGLASVVHDLYRGKLPALPGSRNTWVPVVTADYLARFLAAVPQHAPDRAELWVLDEETPALPELVGHARRLGVHAPPLRIPAGLLRILPRRLTGADPETLSFLSADRYPTTSARAMAHAAGLRQPPLPAALDAWVNHLVATNFGQTVPLSPPN